MVFGGPGGGLGGFLLSSRSSGFATTFTTNGKAAKTTTRTTKNKKNKTKNNTNKKQKKKHKQLKQKKQQQTKQAENCESVYWHTQIGGNLEGPKRSKKGEAIFLGNWI